MVSTSLLFILLFLLSNADGTELEVFLEWVRRNDGVKLFLSSTVFHSQNILDQ